MDDEEVGVGAGGDISAAGSDDPFGDDFFDYDFRLSASEIVRSRNCLLLMTNGSDFLKVVAIKDCPSLVVLFHSAFPIVDSMNPGFFL